MDNEVPYDEVPYDGFGPPHAGAKALGSRIGQLAAGTTKVSGPSSMLGGILDCNGNMLTGMDQINERLWRVLESLSGPQPRQAVSKDSDPPEGTLHTVVAQQALMDEKLREMVQTIEQIEHLM